MKRVALSASLLAMSLLACSGDHDPSITALDDPAAPPLIPIVPSDSFAVRVKVVTMGANADPDGYVVRIQLGYAGGSAELPIGTTA